MHELVRGEKSGEVIAALEHELIPEASELGKRICRSDTLFVLECETHGLFSAITMWDHPKHNGRVQYVVVAVKRLKTSPRCVVDTWELFTHVDIVGFRTWSFYLATLMSRGVL